MSQYNPNKAQSAFIHSRDDEKSMRSPEFPLIFRIRDGRASLQTRFVPLSPSAAGKNNKTDASRVI